MFDPQSFLDSEITESNSTEVIPVPIGEYQATAKEISLQDGTIGKGDRQGQPWARLTVVWNIEDENVKALLERKEVTSRQAIMLDLTESGGLALGKGQNVRLGRLREALGLNEPGKPFNFRMIEGRMAKVRIAHDVYEGVIQHSVDQVVKLT